MYFLYANVEHNTHKKQKRDRISLVAETLLEFMHHIGLDEHDGKTELWATLTFTS